MTIFQRISQACARINRSLGASEGTAEGAAGGPLNPGLRHVEEAERQQFPAEEFAAGEQEESE